MLSIIIAYHNEGSDFIAEAVYQIKQTCDVKYEIIIVDDHSENPLKFRLENVRVVRQPENKGVGQAFDTGIDYAKYNNIFLMGCDVRFSNNQWASKMVAEINKYPKALICTSVVNLSNSLFELMQGLPDDFPNRNDPFNFAKQMSKIDLYRGASILFYMGDNESIHHIIEAQWMPREFLPLRSRDYILPTECYEIPCILGAAYGTTKKWYKYIDGFWGHRFWGTLEPYISMKSWLMGGQCLVSPVIETAHIFNATGNHANEYQYGLYKSYNRMLTAWLLFPYTDARRLCDWLPDKDFVNEARDLIDNNFQSIEKKRNEYRKKFKMSMSEFIKKFGLKL